MIAVAVAMAAGQKSTTTLRQVVSAKVGRMEIQRVPVVVFFSNGLHDPLLLSP